MKLLTNPIPVLLAATLTFGLSSTSNAATNLPTQSYLPLKLAQQLAETALNQCSKDGYAVSVAVVDASGVVKALLRADKAGPHTVGSSKGKAYTSASMGRPTADLAALIKKMPEVAGLRDMDPNILILGGGLPLSVNGERVGGIGVGGAPGGHLDQACAQAAIDKVL